MNDFRHRIPAGKRVDSIEIFERLPVPQAVAALAIPTILSQLVTMIYNFADTFFIGQIGDPYKVASVSLAFPLYYIITSIGNLFGVGGGSLISRLMGSGESRDIQKVSAFCFYGSIASALLYSVCCGCLLRPLLTFLGASEQTYADTAGYVRIVIVLGGPATAVALTLAQLLRSTGRSRQAGFGMMLGGFLNLVFDPILILLLHMQVAGAAVATAVSNVVSLIYFVTVLRGPSQDGMLSLSPADFSLAPIRPVFSVGICAALNTFLAGIGNMLIVKLAARYGDIPVAAFGIVKKIDMLPINISMGLCQGYMPLLGYNYASGNYRRMRKISLFTWTCSIVFSLLCIAVSLGGAPVILRFFIRSPETEAMGAAFLRIACLAVPLTAINFLISYALQAIGKARAALLLSALRLGILNIPLLFLLNAAFGLYGPICAQLVTEALSILVSLIAYRREMAKLPGASAPPNV